MAQMVSREERRALVEELFQPDEFGLLAKQITCLQRLAYGGWGMVVLAVVIITVLALRPSLIPYPLIYDPDGRLIWHGQAASAREERFIDVRLVEWVSFCRSASSDETRFVEDRESCAAMVFGKAADKFRAYNQESAALYKDQQKRVLVQVDKKHASISRQGPDRVQITWEETWTPQFGYGAETKRFQVTLTHAWYARPSHWTLDQARLNPSRVYVTDFFWDEIRSDNR